MVENNTQQIMSAVNKKTMQMLEMFNSQKSRQYRSNKVSINASDL